MIYKKIYFLNISDNIQNRHIFSKGRIYKNLEYSNLNK